MLDKDTLWVFRAAEGYDIAIAESEIIAIWQAKTPGHTLIERSDGDMVEVVYAFAEIINDFDHRDTRKKAGKKPALVQGLNTGSLREKGHSAPSLSSKDGR